MRTRHLGKALVGLVAVATMVGPIAPPVSADTRTAAFTSGSVTLVDVTGANLGPIGVGTAGVHCTTSFSSTVTMAGSATTGTWAAAVNSDKVYALATTNFRIMLDVDVYGTYSGSTLIGAGGDVIAIIAPTVGTPGSCTVTASPCVVTSEAVTVSGTHTVTAKPTIQTGATFTLTGGNGAENDFGFETMPFGACGGFFANMADGAIILDNLVITV
jgi:hypothetical protein